MSTNRFIVMLVAVALAVVAALTVREARATSAVIQAGQQNDDYALRHPGALLPSAQQAWFYEGSDYALRHPILSAAVRIDPQTDDYALRHPELSAAMQINSQEDDYALRHPELSSP